MTNPPVCIAVGFHAARGTVLAGDDLVVDAGTGDVGVH
jgi:hypothetical protein